MHRDGVPLLIDSAEQLASTGTPTVFVPVGLDDTRIDERWLQELLFRRPDLLPMGEMDQVFAPLRCVAREVPTGVGPLDLLGISPTGFLTVIETKLYRNPQSRREVLGQILDYCSRLTRWSYDDLTQAVRSSRYRVSESDDPLLAAARGDDSVPYDPRRFRSTVTESLRHGRFLLVIVGDSFRESTEQLLEYVQRFMHLQFTIRLIELQMFRRSDGAEYPILVVPKVTARTQEVTRAIVRLSDEALEAKVMVQGVKEQQTTPGLEQFLEELRQRGTPGADEFASLLGEVQTIGLRVDPVKTGLALRFPDPRESGREFRVLRVLNGSCRAFNRLKLQIESAGYDGTIALDYVRTVASWLPHARVDAQSGEIIGADGHRLAVPLEVLANHREDYVAAVKRLLDAIRAAEARRPGGEAM